MGHRPARKPQAPAPAAQQHKDDKAAVVSRAFTQAADVDAVTVKPRYFKPKSPGNNSPRAHEEDNEDWTQVEAQLKPKKPKTFRGRGQRNNTRAQVVAKNVPAPAVRKNVPAPAVAKNIPGPAVAENVPAPAIANNAPEMKTRRGQRKPRARKNQAASPSVDHPEDPDVVEKIETEEVAPDMDAASPPVDHSKDPDVVEKKDPEEVAPDMDAASPSVDHSKDPDVVEKKEMEEVAPHMDVASPSVDHAKDPVVVEKKETDEAPAVPRLVMGPPLGVFHNSAGVVLQPGTRIEMRYRDFYAYGPYGIQVVPQATLQFFDSYGCLYHVMYGPIGALF